MAHSPTPSQWQQLADCIAHAMAKPAIDSDEHMLAINNMISDLEEECQDLKDEADLSVAQLQEVQAQLEEVILGHREVYREKVVLEGELAASRDRAELCGRNLNQVQEELERLQKGLESYILEARSFEFQLSRQDERLTGLRAQRERLIHMIRMQGRLIRHFMAMDARVAMPALKRQVQPWWMRIRLR